MGRAGLKYSGAGLEDSVPKVGWDALDSSTVALYLEYSGAGLSTVRSGKLWDALDLSTEALNLITRHAK